MILVSKNLQQTGKKVKGKNKINKRIESNKNFSFVWHQWYRINT